VHLNVTSQISECLSQISFAGREPAIVVNCPDRIDGYLLKYSRPEIEYDINLVHADVSSLKQVLEKAGSLSCWRHLRLNLFERPTFIVPLDASGGSVFRIKPGAAKVALIRAARST
jgi:hypothetical protein